jgi:hypothetical protein
MYFKNRPRQAKMLRCTKDLQDVVVSASLRPRPAPVIQKHHTCILVCRRA